MFNNRCDRNNGRDRVTFSGSVKRRELKFSFVYNFFGTFNIIVGFLGMMLPPVEGRPSPYIITASLVVGVVMYKTTYSGI